VSFDSLNQDLVEEIAEIALVDGRALFAESINISEDSSG
jgi:hypothetical protein